MSHISPASRSRSASCHSSTSQCSNSRRTSRSLHEAAASLRQQAPDVQGSWFPSGFYGHYRSQYRNDIDFQHSVRQRAMPRPPMTLESKFSISMKKHPFSAHDNKHTYCHHGEYFGNGMGKKKVDGRSGEFKEEFLHWRTGNANGMPGTQKRRSYSSAGNYPGMERFQRPESATQVTAFATTREWSLDGPPPSTHMRGFSAPARLYQPPMEVPVETLMQSCYQKTYCSRSGGRRRPLSTASRPFSSGHSSIAQSPGPGSSIVSGPQSPLPVAPQSPPSVAPRSPPSALPQSPVLTSTPTPIAALAVPTPMAAAE